jgi:hypothetical protein
VGVAGHQPPKNYAGTPNGFTVAAGTTLWRVHSRKYEFAEFNPCGADEHFGGGRFDSTAADPYPYYYAGLTETTALAETFLRGLPYDDRGYRWLNRPAVRERCISAVQTVAPLFLVSLLEGPDLAAVAQDPWLIHAEGAEYARTRAVGRWLRAQAPWAQGLIWPSMRQPGQPTLILFGDRGAAGALGPMPSRRIDLDDAAGADWLNAALAVYRVTVRPPRRTRYRVAP